MITTTAGVPNSATRSGVAGLEASSTARSARASTPIKTSPPRPARTDDILPEKHRLDRVDHHPEQTDGAKHGRRNRTVSSMRTARRKNHREQGEKAQARRRGQTTEPDGVSEHGPPNAVVSPQYAL